MVLSSSREYSRVARCGCAQSSTASAMTSKASDLSMGSPEPHIDFPSSRTIHFARLALLDDPDRGPERKRLLLVTDYDGNWRDHVLELMSLTSDPDAIWGCCAGYAARDRFLEFIREHMVAAAGVLYCVSRHRVGTDPALAQTPGRIDGPPATSHRHHWSLQSCASSTTSGAFLLQVSRCRASCCAADPSLPCPPLATSTPRSIVSGGSGGLTG